MEKYEFQEIIGDGTYGTVYCAINLENKTRVAIKKLKKKITKWEGCIEQNEVKFLSKMSHPNIVKLLEVVIEPNNEIFFVFEYCDCNLFELTDRYVKINGLIPEYLIKKISYQMLSGLNYMHKKNIMHRDLKPENILFRFANEDIKIADLGVTRYVPKFGTECVTDYICTRWYRAPESVLHSPSYNEKIDVWAIGCIIAELYMLKPIFPGDNEIDQMKKIVDILGTPTIKDWPDGYKMIQKLGMFFPVSTKKDLKEILNYASPEAVDFLNSIFKYDPIVRPSCEVLLRHKFFAEFHKKEVKNIDNTTINLSNSNNNNNTINNHKKTNSNNLNEKKIMVNKQSNLVVKNDKYRTENSKIVEIKDSKKKDKKKTNNVETKINKDNILAQRLVAKKRIKENQIKNEDNNSLLHYSLNPNSKLICFSDKTSKAKQFFNEYKIIGNNSIDENTEETCQTDNAYRSDIKVSKYNKNLSPKVYKSKMAIKDFTSEELYKLRNRENIENISINTLNDNYINPFNVNDNYYKTCTHKNDDIVNNKKIYEYHREKYYQPINYYQPSVLHYKDNNDNLTTRITISNSNFKSADFSNYSTYTKFGQGPKYFYKNPNNLTIKNNNSNLRTEQPPMRYYIEESKNNNLVYDYIGYY